MHLHAGERAGAVDQSENADLREVAFKKRIRRLRRRVSDECDALRVDPGCEQTFDALANAARDAVGGVMGRRNLDARDDRAFAGIERYGIGKRTADVDADAKRR